MFKKIVLQSITAATIVVLAGCASFPKEQVPTVSSMPDVNQYQNKPSVFIDMRFFRGNPNQAEAAIEMGALKPQMQGIVERVVNDSALFSHYTFDEFEKDKSDYTLKVYAYNHSNSGAAAVMGFLCGFTFGIIPAAATDNYTLEVEAVDASGNVVEEATNVDAVTTWIGLWFIPLMGNTPNEAVESTLENQIRAALKNLVDSGKLKYSALPYLNNKA